MARRLASLDPVGLTRRGRHFICGSTGTGKSTLAEMLVENYNARFGNDWLYMVDPKKRFVPVEYGEDAPSTTLFPHGYKPARFGRREGVAVAGEAISHPRPPEYSPSEALLLQEEPVVWETFEWLYHHSDVRTPALVYADESFDMVRGFRADKRLRRLIQQGRELGVGVVIINQRPRWIDSVFLSEAEVLYIGALYDYRDREALAPHVQGTPLRRYVEEPDLLHGRQWLYVDRVHWERSRVFEVELKSAERMSA